MASFHKSHSRIDHFHIKAALRAELHVACIGSEHIAHFGGFPRFRTWRILGPLLIFLHGTLVFMEMFFVRGQTREGERLSRLRCFSTTNITL